MTLIARSKARIETREKIIKDCAALMAEQGYCNVSVPEIEKATGKTKAVLYGYFNNRYDITMAVLDHNLQQSKKAIDELVSGCTDNRSKLNAHIQFHHPKTEYTLVGNGCPLFSLAIEAGAVHEEMRKKVAKALLLWKQELAEIIQTGINNQEFREDLSAEDIAWQLISLIESASIISKTTQSLKPGVKLLNQAKNLVANL
ncbi:helix-turn-helix domain-containing protein [Mucilaginibacter sp. dw_454]|uniref:TetR/AcrR family transcriptional regulator n=1 Tax=Mucilaginibacter sp. dw_454 TaxID=2720079 RepID=UPI001BD6D6B1|nr:helix-turn-helix domain-containing protein [Mucilaginibacter sp. dw_454]